MKLLVNELAHIKSAVIEDSQLTVIIGDNGVGKTILLETKTLISNFYSEKIKDIGKEIIKEYPDIIKVRFDWEKIEKFIIDSNDRTSKTSPDFDSTHFENFNLSIDLNSNLETLNREFRKKIVEYKHQVIKDVNEKVTFSSKDFSFELLDLPYIDASPTIEFEVMTPTEDYLNYILSYKPEGENSRNQGGLIRFYDFYNKDLFMKNELFRKNLSEIIPEKDAIKEQLEYDIKVNIFELLFKDYFSNSDILYLPSERNLYVDNALRKAINEMKKNEGENSESKFKSRYSEYLFNMSYLEFIDSMNRFNKYAILIMEEELSILQDLFGGKLMFSKKGEPESIEKNGEIVRKELFSTKENRVIPYILIFDPFNNYKQIIIEEPEAHMSLKSMNDLVKFIERLINSGKSLFITTHSDVFFTKINNLLLTNPDFTSKVYEFKTTVNGSVLEEKIRGEYGYEIDLFSHELNNLFEETLNTQDGAIND